MLMDETYILPTLTSDLTGFNHLLTVYYCWACIIEKERFVTL